MDQKWIKIEVDVKLNEDQMFLKIQMSELDGIKWLEQSECSERIKCGLFQY